MKVFEYLNYIHEEVNHNKLPYIKKIDQRGDISIYVVNGSYIRGHIDEEFTNFGQHYRFSFIPEKEFWLDEENEPDEQKFFIDHLLEEHRLMSLGVSYSEAIQKADIVEREERRKSGDINVITKNGTLLPQPEMFHEILWKTLENGLSVYIVNGRLVRSVLDIDFTQGGHFHVYEFVPENEIWIDSDVKMWERGYVLLHELHEFNRMSEGIPYQQAHEESSKLEYFCRHHPDELHDKLSEEGWT